MKKRYTYLFLDKDSNWISRTPIMYGKYSMSCRWQFLAMDIYHLMKNR